MHINFPFYTNFLWKIPRYGTIRSRVVNIFRALLYIVRGFAGRLSGKESACQCRRCRRLGFYPWVRKIPQRMKWQPTPVSLPEKFPGQRSLAGYSLWGHKESDMTSDWACTHIVKCCFLEGYAIFTGVMNTNFTSIASIRYYHLKIIMLI